MKYWHFAISHPVDIAIACDYVDKHFPDRVGSIPAQCWSWLNKTAEQRIHYSDRVTKNIIVFDPVNKCWLLRGNMNSRVSERIGSMVGTPGAMMSSVANHSCNVPFDTLYERHMENARNECTISPDMLSSLRRIADLELDVHNREVVAYRNRQNQLRAERENSIRRNWNGDLLPMYR